MHCYFVEDWLTLLHLFIYLYPSWPMDIYFVLWAITQYFKYWFNKVHFKKKVSGSLIKFNGKHRVPTYPLPWRMHILSPWPTSPPERYMLTMNLHLRMVVSQSPFFTSWFTLGAVHSLGFLNALFIYWLDHMECRILIPDQDPCSGSLES